MKLKTLIQAGCAFLAFIMVFLPWYVASLFGFSASENSFGEPFVGVLVLLASLAALAWYAVCILKGLGVLKFKLATKIEKIVDIVVPSVAVLCGLIGMIVCFAKGQGFVHPGVGAWLYIILGVAMLVLNFVKLEQTIGKAPAKKAEKKEAKKDEK
jgi:4-amino-4-deoxy-L-arabinose transferase-like glycosyltransferase